MIVPRSGRPAWSIAPTWSTMTTSCSSSVAVTWGQNSKYESSARLQRTSLTAARRRETATIEAEATSHSAVDHRDATASATPKLTCSRPRTLPIVSGRSDHANAGAAVSRS